MYPFTKQHPFLTFRLNGHPTNITNSTVITTEPSLPQESYLLYFIHSMQILVSLGQIWMLYRRWQRVEDTEMPWRSEWDEKAGMKGVWEGFGEAPFEWLEGWEERVGEEEKSDGAGEESDFEEDGGMDRVGHWLGMQLTGETDSSGAFEGENEGEQEGTKKYDSV